MFAHRLTQGDTIGIICPSQILDWNKYSRIIDVIERLGYKVKLGENVTKDTDGYIASSEERAADLNAMVADDSVKMVLFGGGDGAVEVLPLIDYENIRKHPKLFSSYSDATSILNAIHAQTGLVTYYGFGSGEFTDLRYYDYMQFCTHFVEGYSMGQFVSDSKWKILNSGVCEGELIGGYTGLFALMLMNGVVNLATTIPSAPGYIGTFDAPGIAVLVAYGVNKAVAASYTLVLHVALWLPITALGAYYLAREGIQWNEALQKQTQENI